MKQQTDTATPAASPVAKKTTSPTCRPDISPLAAFGLHDGIRITSAHSAFPATFTEQENSGYLDALSNVSSQDELIRLCNERSSTERTRWKSWWSLHPDTKRLLYFTPVSSEWYIRPEDEMQVQELRSERLRILHWLADNSGTSNNNTEWHYHCYCLDRVKAKLVQLTGHQPFNI
jgi:hypothetical protein